MATDTLDFRALSAEQRLQAGLASPAAFYVTGEDALQLTALNSATGVRLTVSGRFMGLDGLPRPFVESLTPTTDRVASSIVRPLGEGWILDLTVVAAAGSPSIGQCWARVQVVRGLTSVGIVLGTLVSGYVTAVQPIAYPRGKVRGTLDGAGLIRSITGTDPAAGVEIAETVPTNARWRFLAARFSLVTDATVSNRSVTFVADDGTTIYFTGAAHDVQAASLTLGYHVGRAIAAARAPAALNVDVPWPATLELQGGHRVRTVTGNLQAGDNYGAPQLLVEEVIED